MRDHLYGNAGHPLLRPPPDPDAVSDLFGLFRDGYATGGTPVTLCLTVGWRDLTALPSPLRCWQSRATSTSSPSSSFPGRDVLATIRDCRWWPQQYRPKTAIWSRRVVPLGRRSQSTGGAQMRCFVAEFSGL
jgi:hypothetical protein